MDGATTVERIHIGIADFKVAKSPAILQTPSLGSCVGVALFDPDEKIGGFAHIMLPDSSLSKIETSPKKFADTGIRLVIKKMEELGAKRNRLVAKIAGGACMFHSAVLDPSMAMGEKNVKAVKKVLLEEKIRVIAEDTGKNYGRTLELHTDTGKLMVRAAKHGVKEL